MQGLAAPLPIPGTYHIDWYIRIGLAFHNILPVFPSVLYFMVPLEGSDKDKDHVPYLQGCCPAMLVVILAYGAMPLLLEMIQPSNGPIGYILLVFAQISKW